MPHEKRIALQIGNAELPAAAGRGLRGLDYPGRFRRSGWLIEHGRDVECRFELGRQRLVRRPQRRSFERRGVKRRGFERWNWSGHVLYDEHGLRRLRLSDCAADVGRLLLCGLRANAPFKDRVHQQPSGLASGVQRNPTSVPSDRLHRTGCTGVHEQRLCRGREHVARILGVRYEQSSRVERPRLRPELRLKCNRDCALDSRELRYCGFLAGIPARARTDSSADATPATTARSPRAACLRLWWAATGHADGGRRRRVHARRDLRSRLQSDGNLLREDMRRHGHGSAELREVRQRLPH